MIMPLKATESGKTKWWCQLWIQRIQWWIKCSRCHEWWHKLFFVTRRWTIDNHQKKRCRLWLLIVVSSQDVKLMLLLLVFFGEIENSDCLIDSWLAIVCRNNTNNTYVPVICILQNFGTCSPWLSYTSYFFWARALRSSSTKLQNKTTYRRGGLTIIIL